MRGWLDRLLGRRDAALRLASPRDATVLAALHASAFNRGWSEHEFAQLLLDHAVICDVAACGKEPVGFILSRGAADEAEILSVAVARRWRSRGLARRLLDLHLRRLAGAGLRTVFLEVDEHNEPARRLYRGAGFHEVGRRPGYYQASGGQAALVLRRDLV